MNIFAKEPQNKNNKILKQMIGTVEITNPALIPFFILISFFAP